MNEDFRVLCKKFFLEKDNCENLRKILRLLEQNKAYHIDFWNYNCMSLLILEEISRCYNIIKTPDFTAIENSRLCTILNIIQTILDNENIKNDFIESELTCYLYPFLNIDEQSQKYEALRIACLGIICMLLHKDESRSIEYLQRTEIVPLSLKIMEIGTETSKYLALHIFSKIASNEKGINYICGSFNRFISITMVFNSMLYQMATAPNLKLIKLMLTCIVTMCKIQNVKASFKTKQLDGFSNVIIMRYIKSDPECSRLYALFEDLLSTEVD